MLDNLSTQNLADDDLFDNYVPAKQPKKEKKEKDHNREKALTIITDAKSKLMADLNIDVGGVAACSYNAKDAFFNIEGIKGEKGDQQIDSQTQTTTGKSTVTFNFCETNMETDKPKSCTEDAFAYVVKDDVCTAVKPSDDNANTFGEEIRDDDDKITGLELTYAADSQQCPSDNTKHLTLTVKVMCPADKDSFGDDVKFDGFEGDECDIVMKYTSMKGCAVFSYDSLHIFLEKYAAFWGAALIILGIFLAFFGNKFVSAVLFMVGMIFFLVAGVGITFYFLQKAEKETSNVANWIIIGGFALVSIPVGYGVMKARKYGIAMLAVWGGVMLGLLLTSTFLLASKVAYWCIVIGCGVIVGLFALKAQETVVMGCTSFIGAYAIVRGISLYVGEFPSEGSLQDMIEKGILTWDNFPKAFFAYLAGIVVIFVASFYYQYKHNKKSEKEKKKN